jgi:hypothetical protein
MPKSRSAGAFLAAAAALSLTVAMPAFGQATAGCVTDRNGQTLCPPADSRCVKTRYGDWTCSPPGGDAVLDRYGNPVCGPGACITDLNGNISCSTQPRGSAALDLYSKAVCTGGCTEATPGRCAPLTR